MLKKHAFIPVLLLGLWHVNCFAEELSSDNDKVLYSLGYELGQDIKGQQLEFTPEILLQGIKDAMANNKPTIDAKEQREALASVHQQRAEDNLRKSEVFLAENTKKEGVTTLPSGLQYKVITAGDGKIPGVNSNVAAHYRGTLMDGTEFASSSHQKKPTTLRVNRVIKGLSEALQMMPVGSKWEIYIPPKLAFGKRSPDSRVPANSLLIYQVELLSIK